MIRRTIFRRLLFSGTTAVLLALCLLFALEVGLRLVFWRSHDFTMEMWKYAVWLKQPVTDPEIGFVHVPSAHAFLMGVEIRTNAFGMRGSDVNLEKPEGAYRVMLLGDSTTLGWGVPLEETTAKLLESRLAEQMTGRGLAVQVLNAGVGNYNTVQEVAAYQRYGRRFRPDLVVLVYFINDAEPVGHEPGTFLTRHAYVVPFLASRLDGILRLLRVRPTWKSYYRFLYDDRQSGWPAARHALHRLATITLEDHTRLLVAILPELREINGEYPFAAQHEKVRAVLHEEGIPALDLIDCLKGHGSETTLFLGGHPKPAICGHLKSGHIRPA